MNRKYILEKQHDLSFWYLWDEEENICFTSGDLRAIMEYIEKEGKDA